jgi:TonB family protein
MDALEPPRLLNEDDIEQRIDASYPPAQRDSGRSGYVILYFKVREDSTVDPASVVVQDASLPAFVAPAAALVPRMRFAPARLRGQPVPVWTTHHVWFQLPHPPGPPDEGTYELAVPDEQPAFRNRARFARQIQARFPPELRASGISGGAVVHFRILENGTVAPESVRVELATEPRFGEAAVSVIRDTRFRPAKVNGRPVKIWMTLPVWFEAPAPAPAESTRTAPAAVRRNPPS